MKELKEELFDFDTVAKLKVDWEDLTEPIKLIKPINESPLLKLVKEAKVKGVDKRRITWRLLGDDTYEQVTTEDIPLRMSIKRIGMSPEMIHLGIKYDGVKHYSEDLPSKTFIVTEKTVLNLYRSYIEASESGKKVFARMIVEELKRIDPEFQEYIKSLK